jgi:hypothetical protein
VRLLSHRALPRRVRSRQADELVATSLGRPAGRTLTVESAKTGLMDQRLQLSIGKREIERFLYRRGSAQTRHGATTNEVF